MDWPNKVWEPGIIGGKGKQLWYSRLATRKDRVRRREYEAAYNAREEIRNG